MEKAGELGLLGTSVPEEFGGLGGDFNTNTFLAMELGTSYSFGVSFAAHTGIGTLPILYYGNAEQKEKYLPKLASGEMKSAYCLTEPTSGSDALSAKTTAKLSDDGKYYILNGQKCGLLTAVLQIYLLLSHKLMVINLLASLLIQTHPDSLVVRKKTNWELKVHQQELYFLDNVKVPVENILGEIGKGSLHRFQCIECWSL